MFQNTMRRGIATLLLIAFVVAAVWMVLSCIALLRIEAFDSCAALPNGLKLALDSIMSVDDDKGFRLYNFTVTNKESSSPNVLAILVRNLTKSSLSDGDVKFFLDDGQINNDHINFIHGEYGAIRISHAFPAEKDTKLRLMIKEEKEHLLKMQLPNGGGFVIPYAFASGSPCSILSTYYGNAPYPQKPACKWSYDACKSKADEKSVILTPDCSPPPASQKKCTDNDVQLAKGLVDANNVVVPATVKPVLIPTSYYRCLTDPKCPGYVQCFENGGSVSSSLFSFTVATYEDISNIVPSGLVIYGIFVKEGFKVDVYTNDKIVESYTNQNFVLKDAADVALNDLPPLQLKRISVAASSTSTNNDVTICTITNNDVKNCESPSNCTPEEFMLSCIGYACNLLCLPLKEVLADPDNERWVGLAKQSRALDKTHFATKPSRFEDIVGLPNRSFLNKFWLTPMNKHVQSVLKISSPPMVSWMVQKPGPLRRALFYGKGVKATTLDNYAEATTFNELYFAWKVDLGFQEIMVINDENWIGDNAIDILYDWLSKGAKAGDSLFLFINAHGGHYSDEGPTNLGFVGNLKMTDLQAFCESLSEGVNLFIYFGGCIVAHPANCPYRFQTDRTTDGSNITFTLVKYTDSYDEDMSTVINANVVTLTDTIEHKNTYWDGCHFSPYKIFNNGDAGLTQTFFNHMFDIASTTKTGSWEEMVCSYAKKYHNPERWDEKAPAVFRPSLATSASDEKSQKNFLFNYSQK
jgi:hypothetical protein